MQINEVGNAQLDFDAVGAHHDITTSQHHDIIKFFRKWDEKSKNIFILYNIL